MTTAIEVREVPSQRLLVKKTTCAHNEIGPAFATAIHAVESCFAASGAKMISTPIAVYLQWRDSDCEMALGSKVEGSVTLTHGCEWLDVPGGSHAFASHYGAYNTFHKTHAAIRNWCVANHMQMSGPCWEIYPTGPGLEPDPSKWKTDVFYPVRA
jgi:effector-binding domain-containing protein